MGEAVRAPQPSLAAKDPPPGGDQDARDAGTVWEADTLAAFLADPRGAMRGTKMAFRGVASDDDIAAILAYLEDAGG